MPDWLMWAIPVVVFVVVAACWLCWGDAPNDFYEGQ